MSIYELFSMSRGPTEDTKDPFARPWFACREAANGTGAGGCTELDKPSYVESALNPVVAVVFMDWLFKTPVVRAWSSVFRLSQAERVRF